MAGLLADDADPLWITQGHALHGPDRPEPRWRRTWVACHDDQVVGAATTATNRIHPARFSCAVEVAPAYRRKGIGRALLRTARAQRQEPLPLAGKVFAHDEAALGLVAAYGGTAYQRCPCARLDPRDRRVRRWCAARAGRHEITSPQAVSPAQLVAAFIAQHLWVHEPWSPVGDRAALDQVASATIADAELTQGAVMWADGRPAALVLAFAGPDGCLEMVAETVHRDVPDGPELLATAVAHALRTADGAGSTEVLFDGHDSDPHLAPLLRELPAVTTTPLLLVELP